MRDSLVAIGSNRRLASGMLSVDFQKPFLYLAESTDEVRSTDQNFSVNTLMWTYGELNPDLFHAMEA